MFIVASGGLIISIFYMQCTSSNWHLLFLSSSSSSSSFNFNADSAKDIIDAFVLRWGGQSHGHHDHDNDDAHQDGTKQKLSFIVDAWFFVLFCFCYVFFSFCVVQTI